MFELSVAFKYLIPKKKQLSVTLIALMSVGVISLVVWLVLVFLSVTEGIEKNWLRKLTDLNAPLKITPTSSYYSSYYYQIDTISNSSQYRPKTIGEKVEALTSDPYNPEEDREVPSHWPLPDRNEKGQLKDPVKSAYAILEGFQDRYKDLVFQDFEMSGAMLKLQLLRSGSPLVTESNGESVNFLTQVSYIVSFPDKNLALPSLLIPPSSKDVNHLFFLANHRLEGSLQEGAPIINSQEQEKFSQKIGSLLQHLHVQTLKTSLPHWKIPSSLIPPHAEFSAYAYQRDGSITHIVLPSKKSASAQNGSYLVGALKKEGPFLVFAAKDKTYPLKPSIPLVTEDHLSFEAKLNPSSLPKARHLKDLTFQVKAKLQNLPLEGEVRFEGLEVSSYDMPTSFEKVPASAPAWTYFVHNKETTQGVLPKNEQQESGILLPKGFQDNGVLLGDRGFLSYTASTTSSLQEQRLAVFVAGFYDPGIMSVGNKCILVPRSITRTINASNTSYAFDKIATNGIQVWFKDLSQTDAIKKELQTALADVGIDSYWKVSSYKEYDFAKDLLQQFQSDKYLFSLVGIIIITVACCNIISLLVLLVNDKKKEIGILQAMGASSKSIALIFGVCGMVMGILGSLIGTCAAFFTLRHIDSLVELLSFLQGHDAFSAVFYGKSLPDQISSDAALFVVILTPLLALGAGLIPALKACFLKPSAILRSE